MGSLSRHRQEDRTFKKWAQWSIFRLLGTYCTLGLASSSPSCFPVRRTMVLQGCTLSTVLRGLNCHGPTDMTCSFQNCELTGTSSKSVILDVCYSDGKLANTPSKPRHSLAVSLTYGGISPPIQAGSSRAQTHFAQPSSLLTLLGLISDCVFPDVCFRGTAFNTAIALSLLVNKK